MVRKEAGGASGEAITVSYLRKVIPDAQKAVVAASATPQDGRLLAHAPDLDMHLDLPIAPALCWVLGARLHHPSRRRYERCGSTTSLTTRGLL